MSPAGVKLRRVLESLSRVELSSVIAFALGLREQIEHDVYVLRGELRILADRLPVQVLHALVRAARAFRRL